ncbi:MAG: outer membrane lipoprotein chaperone LolA [Polyangia bacterium]
MIPVSLILLFAVGDAGAAPASSQAKPARLELSAVIARVQNRYDQAKDFQARFTQKYSRSVVGRVTVSTGQVHFKKPGRMRWDYDKPEARMFLSNGQVLWLYEPEEKQAFKQDLKTSQLPAALAFLMGKGKIADEFEVTWSNNTSLGRPDDYRLSLRPKQPQSTYKSIVFVVDAGDFSVRESLLTDQQGNVNHFAFSDLKMNAKVADEVFRWSPPAKVRVVDTGKMEKQ